MGGIMTRVFVDTRSCRGCWVAAHAAGLYDLDVVALVAKESPNKKLLNRMRKKLRKASAISRISTVEIPCHTVDAIDVVKGLAHSGDVIVTDSAPFAYEFLQREGEATDNFGERYTRQNILEKVRHFHACQELKRQGINPYKPRAYRIADCKRLLQTLKDILEEASGVVPKDMPLKFSHPSPKKKLVQPISALEFEKGPDPKVFVDGDACPQLPAILEVCGDAHMPVIFVSNMEVEDLVSSACKKEPDFMSSTQVLPDMTVEKVPMEKNAADKFIERHISSGDIVLTDDNDLTVKCMNKGALAIDFRGRVLGRPPKSGKVGKKDVRRMKQGSSASRKKKSWDDSFRSSLLQAVE